MHITKAGIVCETEQKKRGGTIMLETETFLFYTFFLVEINKIK